MKDIETNEAQAADAPASGHGENQGRVTITIDNQPYQVRRGQHEVSELKAISGVNPDYVLAQLIDGVLTDLADDQKVHIRGDEIFSSHPRTGGAS